MVRSDAENPDLVQQHVEKNRMGDRELKKKPGKQPPQEADPNDRTPPRKGDPQQVENVPGRKEYHPHGSDPDETYRTGRQGPK